MRYENPRERVGVGLVVRLRSPLYPSPARVCQRRGHGSTDDMNTLLAISPKGNSPSINEMRAVAEAKLYEIQQATTKLLQEIGDAEPREAEMMRSEASRLNGIAFALTRCLCFDQVEKAYRLASGDIVDGEALGVAI